MNSQDFVKAVGAANKSRVGRCKNYELFLFLFMDRLQITTKTS